MRSTIPKMGDGDSRIPINLTKNTSYVPFCNTNEARQKLLEYTNDSHEVGVLVSGKDYLLSYELSDIAFDYNHFAT